MKVSIVIVSYNGLKWIDECLQSLLDSSLTVSIIVIDNNSSDDTVAFIKINYPNVKLIEQQENLGFGKANNIGISYALKQGADYVFLLNQDAFVNSNTIEILIDVAGKYPTYGIISPIHLNKNGTALEDYFSHFVDLENSPNFYSDFILKDKRDEIYETKFVNAAAWLISKKTLAEVGGFDPIFFHYGEDDNYCQRMAYHHYKIGVVPDTFIRHDSIRRHRPSDYMFSDSYYLDFIKFLQVKYANININLSKNAILYEKKKVWKKFIENSLNFNIHSFGKYYKQYKLIDSNFEKIIKSRIINIEKGQHYL